MDRTSEQAMQLSKLTSWLMAMQELSGVGFDTELALKTYAKATADALEIEKKIEPMLPNRKPNKGELKELTPPKRQINQDGTPSKTCRNWFDNVYEKEGDWYGVKDGKEFKLPYNLPVTDTLKTRLKHKDRIKKWLINDKGWKPTWYNVSNKTGKRTSPKLSKQGTICPNLLKIAEKLPEVKLLTDHASLSNRIGVIKGWLNDKRVNKEGVISAGSGGITATHRQRHRRVANVPRISSRLGKEMRGMFCAEDGMVAVGYDASSLEDKIKAHYAYPYDNGDYLRRISAPDYDPHQESADLWGIDRGLAKTGNYALQYNCQPPTLAETLGCSVHQAKEYHEAYWELNHGLKRLNKSLVAHWYSRNKKSIYCYVTGWVLRTRSEHSLVSLLIQHTGAIIMDYAGALMHYWLKPLKFDSNNTPYYELDGGIVKRSIYYHDEYLWQATPEIANKILDMGIKSIYTAGKHLGIRPELTADGDIGNNWTIH